MEGLEVEEEDTGSKGSVTSPTDSSLDFVFV